MEDRNREYLIKWMGECYFRRENFTWSKTKVGLDECCFCKQDSKYHRRNRSFTTSQDFFDVKDKLVENGEWNEFVSVSIPNGNSTDILGKYFYDSEAIDWLLNPSHFCQLAVDYLREKEGK